MADALPVWSVFQVDRCEAAPMQEQIAAFFRRAIADGRLGPGARLPHTTLATVCDLQQKVQPSK